MNDDLLDRLMAQIRVSIVRYANACIQTARADWMDRAAETVHADSSDEAVRMASAFLAAFSPSSPEEESL